VLPWRVGPGGGHADPYRVWLSEVMLQQTTTAAVAPYFRALHRALADGRSARPAAPEEERHGRVGRTRVLFAGAQPRRLRARRRPSAVAFPRAKDELRKLPGLGAYTAAAVAAIAFGRRAVVVDANVERVVARLYAIDEPLPGARAAIRAAADRITPAERAGDFAQAMMDLGATICTTRAPKCLLCPLSPQCQARREGRASRAAGQAAKKAKPQRIGTAFWIEHDGKVWLVRRPGRGMLGGMRALPDDGWSARADGSEDAPIAGAWRAGGVVRHSFTPFRSRARPGDLRRRAVAHVVGRRMVAGGGDRGGRAANAVRQGCAAGGGRLVNRGNQRRH
jgi:A/G-specific adenine glycosylase